LSTQTGYQIKLTGPGLSVDKEVSEELANRITLLVLSGGKSDQQSAGGKAGAGAGSGGSGGTAKVAGKSVREYLIASKATKISQKVTVIGHYLLEAESGKETFTMAELKKGFRDAKEPVPKNPNRDINKTIKLGWIASRDKDLYYVTSTGIQAIEGGFPKGTRRRRRKNKKTSSAKTK
jgi:hypothetical protein